MLVSVRPALGDTVRGRDGVRGNVVLPFTHIPHPTPLGDSIYMASYSRIACKTDSCSRALSECIGDLHRCALRIPEAVLLYAFTSEHCRDITFCVFPPPC